MVGKSVNNNDDENYKSLACGIERIKKNSKYLSYRETQQMDEIYYMSSYLAC
jgi:transcriptional regulatory protein LevR